MNVDIEKLRALLAAATPGPWAYYDDIRPDVRSAANRGGFMGAGHIATVSRYDGNTNDAAFIAAAREALPELLDEVERLRAENAQLRARKAEMCSCVLRYETPGCDDCGGAGAVMAECDA